MSSVAAGAPAEAPPDPAVPQRQVAIMAYGSVIGDAGPAIEALVVERRRWRTPFPVEFARVSPRWGGGPVLVPCAWGGSVNGALLVLSRGVGLGAAVDLLRQREGLPGGRGIVEVAVPGELLVIAASLPLNLRQEDVTPGELARRAVASVAHGPRNGVAYLRRVVDAGVRTPLTAAYERALLELTGAPSLNRVEQVLRGPSVVEGGVNGVG
jgi:hypothetical protein